MESYGKILLIAMPAFLILVLLEKWYGYRKGFDTVQNLDMISSLSSGVTNVTKDVLGLTVTILSYGWLVNHVKLYTIQNTLLTYIVAFIAIDFLGYWVHRISHKINFFWNYHIIHHSSEEFNLACALRQSISGFINIFSFFLLPAALLGVPVSVIAIVAPLHLFAQFWYHTQHIRKMGFLENIIVTPAHHRVHHAINKEYMDKNLSQIFIIWDKLFGTFQKELPDITPVYGITRPSRTWNPIKINFQHLWLLCKDAWRTRNWIDKFRIWWMPTGWRPKDMEEKFPVHKIEDPCHFEKYQTPATNSMKIFYWFQLLVLLGFVSYFFAHIAQIPPLGLLWYGGFIFLHVYALTDLMDCNRSSVFFEWIKMIYGCGLLLANTDWFGISQYLSSAPVYLAVYFIASFFATWYFSGKQAANLPKYAI
jgi:sterol desaturase/sphingolipid hydroxylase (fatty acid hydroxylase superfamily)